MGLAHTMTFDVLFEFEKQLARYTGAPHVVLTDCCTHAIELCMRYDRVTTTEFSAFTYLSVPHLMRHQDIMYTLNDDVWADTGEYQFHGTRIWDSARRLVRNMYRPGQMQCVSFGNGKPLQLGRVGAVLLDDTVAYNTMSLQRSDGRDLRVSPWTQQEHFAAGYHYCPTLEDCAKGLASLDQVTNPVTHQVYPDLRKLLLI
jgi:dTDP-4-amino-4,6-dideoxygalactose transaminase